MSEEHTILDYSNSRPGRRWRLLIRAVAMFLIAATAIVGLKRWLDYREEMVVVAGVPNPQLDAASRAATDRLVLILGANGISPVMFGSAGYAVAVPRKHQQDALALINTEAARNPEFAKFVSTTQGSGGSGAPVQP